MKQKIKFIIQKAIPCFTITSLIMLNCWLVDFWCWHSKWIILLFPFTISLLWVAIKSFTKDFDW